MTLFPSVVTRYDCVVSVPSFCFFHNHTSQKCKNRKKRQARISPKTYGREVPHTYTKHSLSLSDIMMVMVIDAYLTPQGLFKIKEKDKGERDWMDTRHALLTPFPFSHFHFHFDIFLLSLFVFRETEGDSRIVTKHSLNTYTPCQSQDREMT